MSRSVDQLIAVAARSKSKVANATRVLRLEHGARVLGSQLVAKHANRDTYAFVGAMARAFDCKYVLIIGRPPLANLIHLYPDLTVIGLTTQTKPVGKVVFEPWCDNGIKAGAELPERILSQTFIVVEDLHDQLRAHPELAVQLRRWFQHVPCGIATSRLASNSTQDNRVEGAISSLRVNGLNVQFAGLSGQGGDSAFNRECLAVIRNNSADTTAPKPAPTNFRVVAFMAAYNEEDIIVQSIRNWTEQGVAVHILENWSTDSTYRLIKDLQTTLPVTVERFPSGGPSRYFEWSAMLERMQDLTNELQADWFVRRGADEIVCSPWKDVSYRDGLYRVDQEGYSCIDHTILNFHPTDDAFESGTNHERHFRYFQFGRYPSDFVQKKAWKNLRGELSMAAGGHNIRFEGRRVYPFKFLLKHYPIRSQLHGQRKIFAERKARWQPNERAKGWHTHYDHIRSRHQFLVPAQQQTLFDEETFYEEYLTQRLSGVGIKRD